MMDHKEHSGFVKLKPWNELYITNPGLQQPVEVVNWELRGQAVLLVGKTASSQCQK